MSAIGQALILVGSCVLLVGLLSAFVAVAVAIAKSLEDAFDWPWMASPKYDYNPKCPKCGYPLKRVASTTCPECGREWM